MAPVIRACRRAGAEYSILHTGQHYSYEMDRVFFEELELPAPDHNLDVGSGSHAVQTGRIMAGIEKVLAEDGSDIVLVQGDTNTVLAGVLTAAKLHIPIGHVEAGLRSFDRRMPEEISRLVADHLAEYLFAPTTLAEGNLLAEGIGREKIFVSGNTVVDAVFENLGDSEEEDRSPPDVQPPPAGLFPGDCAPCGERGREGPAQGAHRRSQPAP